MNFVPQSNCSRRELLAMMAAAASGFAASGEPPNILYIMADDHASHAISAYGSRMNKTPNIDRIAREGMRLDNCFCTNSICTPSRAAILTGQYSHKNGVYTLLDSLDGSRPNLAKYLQQAGYQTGIVGKWHLQTDPTGFDYWNILPGQGQYYDPVFIDRGTKKKHQGYCTDLIGDFSLEFLKQRPKKKPFFLMSHHKAPHRPWDPAPKYARLFETETIPEPDNLYDQYEGKARIVANIKLRVGENNNERDFKRKIPPDLKGNALRKWAYQLFMKDYLRCVQSVDDNVGRLLEYLDSEGLARNTLVIYTSDQGFFLGDHGWFDKRLMYEEALRMPFLVRYPGRIKPGTVNKDISLNIDFAPTMLDFAGMKTPSEMQGRSFRRNLEGETPKDWRRSMYYRYWMYGDWGMPTHYGIRTQRYKLVYYYNKRLGPQQGFRDIPLKGPAETESEWEFFDLSRDPREMKNLYNDPAYAKIVKDLKAELARLQKECGDKPA